MSVQSFGPGGRVTVFYRERLISCLKYDVVAVMQPNQAKLARVPVAFETGVIVVGFKASVRPLIWGSFTASGQLPTPDDVLVDWDYNTRNKLASTESAAGATLQDKRNVTTLAALADPDFFVMKRLPANGSAPVAGFTFVNRYDTAGPGMLPAALSIRLTIHVQPIDEAESETSP